MQVRLDAALGHTDDVGERDPRTGLHTTTFLTRWTAGLGADLPVGLVLLRIPGIADVRASYGPAGRGRRADRSARGQILRPHIGHAARKVRR